MARRRSGKKIDSLRWIGFSTQFFAQAAGSAAATVLAATTVPDTIMRTRGTVLTFGDGTLSPPLAVDIALGMAVVPEGTGSTVLWSPITDANAPWFWYTRFTIGYEEQVTDVIAASEIVAYRQEIDSKAMRRAAPDTEVQLVIENVTIAGALNVNASVTGRFLVGF